MPAVRYRQNQGFVVLQEKPGDDVPILGRDGKRRYFRWLGFIDVNVAKQLPGAKPVRLDIDAYAIETYPIPPLEALGRRGGCSGLPSTQRRLRNHALGIAQDRETPLTVFHNQLS